MIVTTLFSKHTILENDVLIAPVAYFRKGLRSDLVDRRCDALKSICQALRAMKLPPRYIVLENVRGFETSFAHSLLRGILLDRDYRLEVSVLISLVISFLFNMHFVFFLRVPLMSRMLDLCFLVLIVSCCLIMASQSIRCFEEPSLVVISRISQ